MTPLVIDVTVGAPHASPWPTFWSLQPSISTVDRNTSRRNEIQETAAAQPGFGS